MARTGLIVMTLSLLTGHGGLAAGDSQENIRINADYAAYRIEGDTSNAYVEIFYNFPRRQLKFDPDTAGYVALMDFAIWLKDSGGTTIDSAFWRGGSRIDNLSVLEDSEYLITDMVSDNLPFGDYTVGISVTSGDNSGRTEFTLEVPAFDSGPLQLSSLELAYEMTPDTSGKFSKSGYRVLPNPSGRFSQSENVIYIYAEAYNFDAGADSVYSVGIDILDSGGLPYKTIPEATYTKPGRSAVIMTGFSYATLPRGSYTVRLSVRDGQFVATGEKSFTVMASRERLRQEMLQAVLREFPESGKLENEQEAARFRDDITFIAAQDELRFYDSLNLEGKRNFQRDFWQKRDPDPSTPENEFQLEHYRRIKYCDEQFSQYKGIIGGWETDMGRVYIVYGEPSEIERNQSTIEERNWQRWWYDSLEGGVYFIFVDFEDTGAYKLVHSSKQNEIKDYNWQDKVKMTLFQR